MKKILITGADGFIGSHLVEYLVKNNYDVKALTLYNSFNLNGWIDDIPIKIKKNTEIIKGDITDSNFCHNLTKNVDKIINLAALIAIPYSYIASESYFKTNLIGTLNLLNSVKNKSFSKFIQISTSEVYGSAKYTPIDENHPFQPQSPYSASKISSDSLALSYYYSYNFPVVIARPFNTYGPRQSTRAVIPTIITQALKSKKIKLGTTSTIRDFNYVLDTCHGIHEIVKTNNIFGETFNIGSGIGYQINDIVDLIKKILNKDINIISEKKRKRPKASEVSKLISDNSKIIKYTNYKPKIDLNHGLSKTVRWIVQNIDKKNYTDKNYTI